MLLWALWLSFAVLKWLRWLWFIPRGDRPVYCSSCYNKVRATAPKPIL